MENKHERYQKAMNIIDVLEGSQFAKIMQKGLMLNELNQNISRLFPQEFKGLFRLGSITDGKLFVEVKVQSFAKGFYFAKANYSPQFNRLIPK